MAVRNTGNVLLDNWAFIQTFGYIVAGGTNNFHPAFESRMIGFCSRKSGQEGMMDVDDFVFVFGYQVGRDNLHVTCQNDKVNSVLLQ